jgi:spore maturation protein CgeB
MKVHVKHPGVQWSLSDVFDGLCLGLTAAGVTLVCEPERADWVILVNGNRYTAEQIHAWRRVAKVAVLCTESPYDTDHEIERVAVADAAWTHERLTVPTLKAVNPQVAYLPHAWHPERHAPLGIDDGVPAHDVVFVGGGFSERVTFLNRIDWTGIDLGLYGIWHGLGLEEWLEPCIKGDITQNAYAAQLYRKAKINLNLYRTKAGIRKVIPRPDVAAESLNPRAYELGACGAFHLSTHRKEIHETFGNLVPIVETPQECEAAIREWLPRETERRQIGAELTACVAGQSWIDRAQQVVNDLQVWSAA